MDGASRFSPAASRISASTVVNIARAFRDFGDGFVAVLLPVYLLHLGLSEFDVGVVSTLTLLGSTAMTLGVGLVGRRWDQRLLLILAACLMFMTGLAFAATETFPVLLLIALVGTINPSSGSASIFVPLEHAVLSRVTLDGDRTRMFARYSLMGALAGALGALVSGSPDLLMTIGLSATLAFKSMFVAYGLLGLVAAALYARLPRQNTLEIETADAALGPSRRLVYKMTALFSIDAFAGGFVVQSLLALWLFNKFGLSLQEAGLFFFWAGVLSAFSFPVAAWLSRRVGLINTMVFTHIPSSLCLIVAAFVPNVEMALGLLLVRAALSQMDVPTRSSYVMAVVTPAERPAAASFTSVPRGLAAAISPVIAGAFFAAGLDIWPLMICGGLKIAYDLILLRSCRHVKPPEER